MKKIFRTDGFVSVAIALIALAVYLATLSPSIQPGDAGELATAAATLGIAHPTGYPLFSLLGRAVACIPLGETAWRLNFVMAALCAAFAAFFFARTFLDTTAESNGPLKTGSRGKTPPKARPLQSKGLNWTAATAATLILGFSRIYWSQATSLEVYALHLLLLSLVVWLFLRSLRQTAPTGYWYGFAFALGLGFTNHLTTILLAPGLLYLHFSAHGSTRAAWRKIGLACAPFLAGLSVYLYLPVRASQNPLMNWGDPGSPGRFFRHVSGAQFGTKMFSETGSAVQRLWNYVSSLPGEFGYLPLFFAILGAVHLFRNSRGMLAFSLLLLLTCLLYAANYDIPDIESYFLLAHVAMALWIFHGVRVVLAFGEERGARWTTRVACLATVLLPLLLHFRSMDRSRDHVVEDYARNVLASTDSGAIVFSNEEQDFLFPALYLQHVGGLRKDVAILNIHLMRLPWYYAHLEQLHPHVLESARAEVDAYLAALRRSRDSEYGGSARTLSLENYPARKAEQFHWNKMIRALVLDNAAIRPVYATIGLAVHGVPDVDLQTGIEKLPSGLAFRLFSGAPSVRIPPREFSFRPLVPHNRRTGFIQETYAAAHTNQGLYQAFMLGDTAAGVASFGKALAINPADSSARKQLRSLAP